MLTMVRFLIAIFLYCAGDVARGGRKLSEEEGHFNDNRKPSGFDTKQIFVSRVFDTQDTTATRNPKGNLKRFMYLP